VLGGVLAWPFDRAEQIMSGYRRLTETAPRELTAFLVVKNAPSSSSVPPEWRGRRIIAMTVCYTGDLARAGEVLAPLRSWGEPVIDTLQEWPYLQQQSYFDSSEPTGHHYYWRTQLASGLTDDMLATCREVGADLPVPQAQVSIAHIGGALNERSGDDGAVGNRDARFVNATAAHWRPLDPRADEYLSWARRSGDRLRRFSTGGTYVNFQTEEDGAARLRATYGPNWQRLVEVKRKYDPDNLFRMNRNIDAKG
jgi:hypothetical protein